MTAVSPASPIATDPGLPGASERLPEVHAVTANMQANATKAANNRIVRRRAASATDVPIIARRLFRTLIWTGRLRGEGSTGKSADCGELLAVYAGATHQRPVDVDLCGECARVIGLDRSAVNDPDGVRDVSGV